MPSRSATLDPNGRRMVGEVIYVSYDADIGKVACLVMGCFVDHQLGNTAVLTGVLAAAAYEGSLLP